MSAIYISTDRKNKRVSNMSEIRELLEKGALDESHLYWKEGMEDWQPIRLLVAEGSTLRETSPDKAAKPRIEVEIYVPKIIDASAKVAKAPFDGNYELTCRQGVVTWLMYFAMAVLLVACAGCIKHGIDLMMIGFEGGTTQEIADSVDAQGSFFDIFHTGAFIFANCLFLLWVSRANRNCRGFHAQGMQFSPTFAAGSFLVPIVNLFKPYAALCEIWKVSSSPSKWTSQPSGLIGLWWAFVIMSIVLVRLSNVFAQRINDISDFAPAGGLEVASCGVQVAVIVTLVIMVTLINRKQMRLVAAN